MTRLLIFVACAAGVPGCISKPDFRPRATDFHPVEVPQGTDRPTARDWAPLIHKQIAPLLPGKAQRALHVQDLPDPFDRPVDVCLHFGLDPYRLERIFFGNWDGLHSTAAVVSPDDLPTPDWPDFRHVEIPVADGEVIVGRLAEPVVEGIDGSFIVIGHGIFSDLRSAGYRGLSDALRLRGHHVLALEMRGHGETRRRQPKQGVTFGVEEALDLIAVDHWLRRVRGARRVGMIGFSLSAKESILAAWVDNRPGEPTDVESPLWNRLPGIGEHPVFDAGILAISPSADTTAVSGSVDYPRRGLDGPVKAALQDKCAQRMASDGAVPVRRLWAVVKHELEKHPLAARYPNYTAYLKEVLDFLELRDHDWHKGQDRLARIRTPLLILHAADDPLAMAQDLAGLCARVTNPNVGLILLGKGGHTGFAALSRPYFYSLAAAFFDPKTGPQTASPGLRPRPDTRPAAGEDD